MSTKYTLKRTAKYGFGLYAQEKISKGSVIVKCPYLVVGSKGGWTAENEMCNYSFYYPYTRDNEKTANSKLYAVVFGDASMINHSNQPNADWRWNPKTRMHTTFATRDILVGEQIFFDYGPAYVWK